MITFNNNNVDFVLDWSIFLMGKAFYCHVIMLRAKCECQIVSLRTFIKLHEMSVLISHVCQTEYLSVCVVLLLRVYQKGQQRYSACVCIFNNPGITDVMPPPEQKWWITKWSSSCDWLDQHKVDPYLPLYTCVMAIKHHQGSNSSIRYVK